MSNAEQYGTPLPVGEVSHTAGGLATPEVLINARRATTTGLQSGGIISVIDATTLGISSGSAQIADPFATPPGFVQVPAWGDAELDVSAQIADSTGTLFIGMADMGEFITRLTPFTEADKAHCVPLGRCGFINGALTTPINEQEPVFGIGAQLFQLLRGVGNLAIEGLDIKPAGGLNIKVTAGKGFRFGANYGNSIRDPHTRIWDELPTPIVRRVHRDGSGGFAVGMPPNNEVTVDVYDNGSGTPVALAQNRWQVIPVFFSIPSGLVLYQLGQERFNNLNAALRGLQLAEWEPHPTLSRDVARRAFILARGNCTNLATRSRCRIVRCDRFGAPGGPG